MTEQSHQEMQAGFFFLHSHGKLSFTDFIFFTCFKRQDIATVEPTQGLNIHGPCRTKYHKLCKNSKYESPPKGRYIVDNHVILPAGTTTGGTTRLGTPFMDLGPKVGKGD